MKLELGVHASTGVYLSCRVLEGIIIEMIEQQWSISINGSIKVTMYLDVDDAGALVTHVRSRSLLSVIVYIT